jgi:hypothetical protein
MASSMSDSRVSPQIFTLAMGAGLDRSRPDFSAFFWTQKSRKGGALAAPSVRH